MKKEDELYIELQLSTVLELYLESDYTIDKMGNLVFKDKDKIRESINKSIFDFSEKSGICEDEVRAYLVNIYKDKCSNPKFIKQGTELISILQESKEKNEDKEDNQTSKIDEKENR